MFNNTRQTNLPDEISHQNLPATQHDEDYFSFLFVSFFGGWGGGRGLEGEGKVIR